VTILEVINRSAEFLAKKGVDSARLQIELILAHVLGVPRLKLYLNFERELTDEELDAARTLVKRRANREPLQHLLGSTSFCGFEIAVTPAVLIPRPETELLASRAWEYVSSITRESVAVLDFGTGSGCLAISIAAKCPRARIHAVDISDAALAVARENARTHGTGERITFCASDGFAALPGGLRFDLIVSNPPYIPSEEIGTLDREVRDFDPRLALDGGADGLDFYRRLAEQGSGRLREDGRLMAEFGDGQAEAVRAIFEGQGWKVEAVEKDFAGKERFVIAGRVTMRR
jgi:release factor glutamine methyltransferase